MRRMITIQEKILIQSNKEHVWGFTQDFEKRKLWDKSILDYQIVQESPKVIWVKMKGGIKCLLEYKLCDKPNKTSLKMSHTRSLLVKGGGGSWQYTEKKGNIEWVQVNTIELRNRWIFHLFGWLIGKKIQKDTEVAMKRAKLLIEKES